MALKNPRSASKSEPASGYECAECGAELKVVRFAGAGEKGLFWHCGKCGFKRRTGQ